MRVVNWTKVENIVGKKKKILLPTERNCAKKKRVTQYLNFRFFLILERVLIM